MGIDVSKEEKQEQKILQSPCVGQASDLYWASRAGDVDAVKLILSNTSFTDLNRLEPNGSTALHAASFFGHVEVVRLLLQERGVMRHRKNRHGLTAYEEAANDEIRQLFHRPNTNRFNSDSTDDNENIFDFQTDQLPEDDNRAPDDWVEGVDDELDVRVQKSAMQLVKLIGTSPLLRTILWRLEKNADDPEIMGDREMNKLQGHIDQCIAPTHPQYDKACELLSKYANTKKPEHLLRLYTLETPFCYKLGTETADDFKIILLLRLKSLKARGFRGLTYRGLSMTKADFRAYQWARKRKGSIISIKSFCSTSVDEAVARRFLSTSSTEKINVLMIFDFPQRCDMAIQLFALSKDLPCISDFEDEREVLLVPSTMFHVVNIMHESSSDQYTIHLENVLPELDFMALYFHWRKCRNNTNGT